MSMRLILQEYLAQLKESKELDQLLPTLLEAMGFTVFLRPQVGIRQFGADIAAVGPDKRGHQRLFVFVVKCGDIGRNDWNSDRPQSIRPTLEEVLDVFFESHIPTEYAGLPRTVVLASNGVMKQEVTPTWAAYGRKWRRQEKSKLEFWGISNIAELVERHLLSEFVFSGDARSLFRRALATLDDPDGSVFRFEEFVHAALKTGRQTGKPKELIKALRLVALGLSIYSTWARTEDNLRPALIAAERTTLKVWAYIVSEGLIKDASATVSLEYVLFELLNTGVGWEQKFRPYYATQNAFAYRSPDSLFVNEQVFEQIGILGLQGLILGVLDRDPGQPNQGVIAMGDCLVALLNTHSISNTPAYDNQASDIAVGMLLLIRLNRLDEAKQWLAGLVKGIQLSRRIGRFTPCSSDLFEDAVSLRLTRKVAAEKASASSTLIPVLAHLCAVLGDSSSYQTLVEELVPEFVNCSLQVWHPDKDYETLIGGETEFPWQNGVTEAPYELPPTLESFQANAKLKPNGIAEMADFEFMKSGFVWMPLIACRTFRGPVPVSFFDGSALSS